MRAPAPAARAHEPDSLRLSRLSEMGIDVYLPRQAHNATPPDADPSLASRGDAAATSVMEMAEQPAAAVVPGVLLVAHAQTRREQVLLADVERALRLARIACRIVDGSDEATVREAAALVLFGQARARAVGAGLSAHRQGEVGWVVTVELADLAGDAQARRALWSELRRMLRQLGHGRQGVAAG